MPRRLARYPHLWTFRAGDIVRLREHPSVVGRVVVGYYPHFPDTVGCDFPFLVNREVSFKREALELVLPLELVLSGGNL